jgi:hypothetical protein
MEMPATSEAALTKSDSNTLTFTSVSPLASITNENGATASPVVPKSSTTHQVANTYTSAHATTILTQTTIHSSSIEEKSESASTIVLSLANPNIASSSTIKSSSAILSPTGHTPSATTTDQLSTQFPSSTSNLPSSTSTPCVNPSGTTFNSGQVMYNQIYYGSGYTESYINPGNDFLVPIIQQYPSTQNACTALANCMQFSFNQEFWTIDLHLVQNVDTTTVWECVAFYDPVRSGDYFTVQNSTILVGYGYDYAGG